MAGPYGIGERLMDRYPEIEKVITLSSDKTWGGGEYRNVSHDDKKINAQVYYSYADFFDIFSFELLKGNKAQVLADPEAAVISESFARAFFGNTDPIGQTIRLTETVSVTVSGVMKDISHSIIPYCDILTRIERMTEMYPEMNKNNYSNAFNSVIFLVAKPGVDLPSKADDMAGYFKEFYWLYEKNLAKEVTLMPLKDAYFSNTAEHSWLNRGDRKFVTILFSVGILILIFAVINYINLSVAQTGARAKEVALRSLLGGGRTAVFGRLMLESILLCGVSFLIGLLLATAFLPSANQLLQTRIDLSTAFTLPHLLLALLFII